ncbi:MAG: tRNA pseudouridine synthase A [Nitrososphaerota archaeon]
MAIYLKYSDPPWIYRSEEIVVKEAESDPAYGEQPNKRSIDGLLKYGFIPLDKHVGPTSHDLAAHVKRILGIGEVGHGGTLEVIEEIPPCLASCQYF